MKLDLPIEQFVERIEGLEEEKAAIAADIKDVYEEAKDRGIDTKALRELIKIRKMDEGERFCLYSNLNLYWQHMGHQQLELFDHLATGLEGEKAGVA